LDARRRRPQADSSLELPAYWVTSRTADELKQWMGTGAFLYIRKYSSLKTIQNIFLVYGVVWIKFQVSYDGMVPII
jgi:hypothetical protein